MRLTSAFLAFFFFNVSVGQADLRGDFGKGINSGLAVGVLKVVKDASEFSSLKWNAQTIYLLPSTPPTIKPIAGVLTKSSGSAISHVQLLCRSLGIPNANISNEEFSQIAKLDGMKIAYISSENKPVRIKKIDDLSADEKKIIEDYQAEDHFDPVSLPKTDESITKLVDLADVRKEDSGKVCGPKAANLGTLKAEFPDRVSDGFVIPFGVVKKVFDESGVTDEIVKLKTITGIDETKNQLAVIRKKIKGLALPETIETAIKENAALLLKENNGAGLFVRSDTNVEDLKVFTGAGLNTTVPNVLTIDLVTEAIKEVWASPWSERSQEWRVKYIKNPEAILPSVLVMQSVDSYKAGVFVLKNLKTGSLEDVFVSLSEGLGIKVVDGLETPEEKIILADRVQNPKPIEKRVRLVRVADASTKLVLDNKNGGVKEENTTLKELLTFTEASQIESIGGQIRKTFGSHESPVWESEFGILKSGKVMLFQARPFNENTSDTKIELIRSFLALP